MTDKQKVAPLPDNYWSEAVDRALAEDLGRAGDVTSQAIFSQDAQAQGAIVARAAGVVAGLRAAQLAFYAMDADVAFHPQTADGERVSPGDVLAAVEGPTLALLSAERVALNFLGHLSGVATATAHLVGAVHGTKAHIACTRKTTPGLRALEKYAVRAGGGVNHRYGLDDAVLIKDNHIAAAGGVTAALTAAKARAGHMMKVEIEVDSLDQLDEVLKVGADCVLLDNMSLTDLREAVRRIDGQAIAEASGGVTIETVRPIAETGVNVISSGWITHSAPCLDLGLDF